MLQLQYGFLADPAKETWENIGDYFGSMPLEQCFVGRPTNMACHDICTNVEAPIGIGHLLRLGGKYCKKKTILEKKTLNNMYYRLRTNIRWKYMSSKEDEREDEYIPELHINTNLVPDLASEKIERAINNFEKKIRAQRAKYASRLIYSNLTLMQRGLTRRLHKNDIYKVMFTDKNCRLAIIEMAHLTEKGVAEHLSNHKVYQKISEKTC